MASKSKIIYLRDHGDASPGNKPFQVIKTKNTTTVRMGESLSLEEVNRFISGRTYDVIITPATN